MAFKSGKLTIVTQIDEEQETSSSFAAEMEISPSSVLLRYTESGSLVVLALKNDEITIDRTGDYNFHLRLKEGQNLPASLGVAGASGDLTAYTDFLRYSVKKNSFLLSMKYALLFANGEKQEMKIRLVARLEDNSEEK